MYQNKPALPSVSEYDIFGKEGVVYPGHPVCLAYLIMLKYPSLEMASFRPRSNNPLVQKSPLALTDGDIPCAGGNVFGALDVLRRARDVSPEAAFEFGTDWWKRCASGSNFPDRQAPGLAQAESIKADFLARAAEWVRNTTPAADATPLPEQHSRLDLVGAEVEWSSQSGGHTKVKTGIIVDRVSDRRSPNKQRFPDLYRGAGPGLPRKEVSYVVAVKTGENAVKHYWPRVSALRLLVV